MIMHYWIGPDRVYSRLYATDRVMSFSDLEALKTYCSEFGYELKKQEILEYGV